MPFDSVEFVITTEDGASRTACRNVDQQLIHEAEMMEKVARVRPLAVCQLLFQPRHSDGVMTMESGAKQPVSRWSW